MILIFNDKNFYEAIINIVVNKPTCPAGRQISMIPIFNDKRLHEGIINAGSKQTYLSGRQANINDFYFQFKFILFFEASTVIIRKLSRIASHELNELF